MNKEGHFSKSLANSDGLNLSGMDSSPRNNQISSVGKASDSSSEQAHNGSTSTAVTTLHGIGSHLKSDFMTSDKRKLSNDLEQI